MYKFVATQNKNLYGGSHLLHDAKLTQEHSEHGPANQEQVIYAQN